MNKQNVCVTHRFTADEAGTFWYHSHMDMQRMDGLQGAFIVHDPNKPSPPGFIVMGQDWLHMDSNQFMTTIIGGDTPLAAYVRELFYFCVLRF